MLPRNACLALLACLFASLASCAPIGFGRQELTLRHDAKADAVDLLIVYDAIQANQDDAEISRGFASRVSGGRRELMIFDWPMHFVLDDIKEKVEGSAKGEPDPWRDWQRELVRNFASVKVSSSGYFRGDTAQLGLYQCLRIGDAAHWIALFERALYIGIETSLAEGAFDEDFALLDPRTRELWTAMAKEKKGWLSLKDGVLTVDLPATGACAGRVLGEIMKHAGDDSDTAHFFAGLSSHLTEMKIAEEHVVLRWKLAGPTFTFAPPKEHEYDDRLAQSLRDSKALPESVPSRQEVNEIFSRH